MGMKTIIKRLKYYYSIHVTVGKYYRRFKKYAYVDCECKDYKQFEASITRLYHTIEKGLSFVNYRAGSGVYNVERLLISLEQYYESGYDISAFCYETALSCLQEYIKKNKEYGYGNKELEDRINQLPGKTNQCGGTTNVFAPVSDEMSYEKLITTRRSIGHFSTQTVDMTELVSAIELAQTTPSACNRQSWRTIVVNEKSIIASILKNQNGNKGFGQEIDKLLVIVDDIRSQQRDREVFQAYIDGGMYAESVLNALFYKGIGSIPLSAALTYNQEKKIRTLLELSDSEVIILFIGVGCYPEGGVLTTKSARKPAEIEII